MAAQPSEHSSAGFNVGDVIAGKYRIESILGAGGMGVVVSALHLQLDDRVAIKFLLPEALDNPDVVARFAREARAAVKIKSEHVARVIDVGRTEAGAPYMVMEYLQGADLGAVIEKKGALPVERAVDYLPQGCEAIAEAHALGIVHRDLKPANLFVTRRPDGVDAIKVLDFGISKMTGGVAQKSGMALTGALAVMGSPLYMSPEQMSSTRDVDARTDIWALGAILFECLTGRPPFDAETMPQLCAMILQDDPPAMGPLRPGLPLGLEAVVRRCLTKDRERRFLHVGELAVALLPFGSKRARPSVERITRVLESSGVTPISLPPSLQPPPAAPMDTAPIVAERESRDPLELSLTASMVQPVSITATTQTRSGVPRSAIGGAVAALALLCAIAFWLLSRDAPKAAVMPPTPAAPTLAAPTLAAPTTAAPTPAAPMLAPPAPAAPAAAALATPQPSAEPAPAAAAVKPPARKRAPRAAKPDVSHEDEIWGNRK
jgi:serine/threonine-protein kinase